MKSNEIYDKRNGTTVRYDRNSLRAQLRDETKTDSSKIHVVSKSVANDHAVDNRAKEQQSAAHDGPMRKSSNYDNESKKAQGKEMQKCDDSIDSRYQLNSRNYVMELHRALIKECKDNVIDFNAIHITLDSETLNNVTHQAFKAVKDQKVFSVLGYFPKITEELKNRGWMEKRDPFRHLFNYAQYLKSTPYTVNWVESPPLISPASSDRIIWDRLKNIHSWNVLKDKRSDLIFATKKRLINWTNLHELTTVSQMTKTAFCSKNGLAQCLELYKNTLVNLMFPRCHYIRNQTDYAIFLEDYIITALTGTLKIIIQSIEENRIIFSKSGNIPYEMITFVQRCVFKYLAKQQTGGTEIDIWDFENEKIVWNEFMEHYTKLIIDEYATFFYEYSYYLELDVYAKCCYLLEYIKVYCPQHYIDGFTNTWIIKPIANCSGHGILMSRDLDKITEKNQVKDGLRNSYILQKYIEKPLLIYTCKIDLRQWFLVTNMNPVIVWMYKEGYVRFCSNSFTMQNMHESIHLSNVRLQMKYRKTRRLNVPEECMWDYKELQNHLATIGQQHVWEELIFPGMSESIYSVIEASKAESSYRPRTFQLFGADFVITDNFVPFLIEVNSIPGLNPSTSVIANLAPMLLGDIVKVVVDYAENSKADTGLFTKVVPEIRKPTITAPIVRRIDDEIHLFAAPKTSPPTAADLGQHRQWAENVNKRLAAMRFTINDLRKFPTDRYLSYNRDSMLMTATSFNASANVDATKTTGTLMDDYTTTLRSLVTAASTANSDESSSSDQKKLKRPD